MYTVEDYVLDIEKNGLKKTWHTILNKTINNKFKSNLFNIDNYGELYEIGLEKTNKISKKEKGKYYTPKDVASILSKWLIDLKGENVCDVGCGTGNLILNYLEIIGEKKAIELLSEGRVYLYDMDEVAIEICKYSIAIKYGKEYLKKIHAKVCDFLDKKVRLPKNSKVICNPPYYKIIKLEDSWELTNVIKDSKEYYSSFMEKIIKQSDSSVIITPYSFIGSDKFYSLRLMMNNYNGFIVSFDNVPGNIFNGRKHGIFNSNSTNSVRAAVTVTENKKGINGYRISPLIRFKSEERDRLLNNEVLYKMIDDEYQVVSNKNKPYHKCFIKLNKTYNSWVNNSKYILNQYITNIPNNNKMVCVPTTCRYFTVGSSFDLSRDGKRLFYLKDNKHYDYIYALFNSSFCYWWWRLVDGGINCSISLIKSIPVFYDLLSENDKEKLHKIVEEMISKEKDYLVYKMNAGKKQESIKFPKKYRDQINNIFLKSLGAKEDSKIFDIVHSSSIFKESEGNENE